VGVTTNRRQVPLIEKIDVAGAPAPGGPYSHAVAFGDLVFTSGQLPLDENGVLVPGGVPAETRQGPQNPRGAPQAAGASLPRRLHTTVYLVSRDDWPAMNEVYAEVFGDHYPARSAIPVGELGRGARVEIEAIAARNA